MNLRNEIIPTFIRHYRKSKALNITNLMDYLMKPKMGTEVVEWDWFWADVVRCINC